MPLPIRELPIPAFLGDQESHESLTLAQIHSSGGSKNIWLNKLGSIEPIGGYSKTNVSPVTGGAGPMRVIALRGYSQFTPDDGGILGVHEIVAIFRGDETANPGSDPLVEFRTSPNGAEWTLIGSFTNPLSAHNIYFAQLGSTLVICGITITPMKWDGAALTALNTLQTLAAPTVAANGAGNLTGRYKYRVVDKLSDGTRGPSRPVSVETTLIANAATVTWVASSSPLIASYEIYRTTGNDTVFFQAGSVGSSTLTFADNISDFDLAFNGRVLQEHGDAPPYALYCFVHKQRVFYGQIYNTGRDLVYPRRWYYSDPGMPDSVYQDRSFFDLDDSEGAEDITTGGVGDFNDTAVLFCEKSIWVVSGTGRYIGAVIDYDKKRTKARTGTVNVDTVLRMPQGSVYTDDKGEFQRTELNTLAYLTPELDIRLFDGDNDIIVSGPVAKTLRTMAQSYAKRGRCRAVLDDERGEAIWLITANGGARPTKAVVWNYRHGVWYVREWAFASILRYHPTGNKPILIAGEADVDIGGFVYKLWDGNTFDGSSYIVQWMSKSLYGLARSGEMEQSGELFTHTKRFRWLETLMGLTGPLTLEIAWLPYEADDDDDPVGTIEISPGESGTILSADGNVITSSDGNAITVLAIGKGAITRAQLLDTDGRYYHDRGIRLRIRAASDQ